jgi:hypothetical protein
MPDLKLGKNLRMQMRHVGVNAKKAQFFLHAPWWHNIGNEGIVPLIQNLGIRWRSVAASAALSMEKSLLYSLNRRSSASRCRPGRFGEEISLSPAEIWTPDRPDCSPVTKQTQLARFFATFRCSAVLTHAPEQFQGRTVNRKYASIVLTEQVHVTLKPSYWLQSCTISIYHPPLHIHVT